MKISTAGTNDAYMQEVDVEKEFKKVVKFVPKFVVKLPKAITKPEPVPVAPIEEAANATS